MKYLFAIILTILLAATGLNHWSQPEVRSEKPILYWVTNANEVRERQVEVFYEWLRENGYPEMEIRLDSSNRDISKKLIQGVSGVGADIIDMGNDEPWLLYSTGMLTDLSDLAAKHGFVPEATWQGKRPSIVIEDTQVGFPKGATVQMYFVNAGLLERVGMEPPPGQWDHATFEALGREFVKRANPPGERRTIFFADNANRRIMRRSMGLSEYNERMTRCTLDDPRSVETYRKLHRWIFEDRILPTPADLDFYAKGDTITSRNQLFVREQFAMVTNGRFAMIQLRAHPELRLTVREPPHGHFRNSLFGSASTAIYANSDKKELAAYLLEFFTSERFNMTVVEGADALPPVPNYTEIDAFRRPVRYPNEWEVHAPFADAAREIGINITVSPYVLPYVVNRIERNSWQSLISGAMTPEEAAADAAARTNRQIQENILKDRALRMRYEKDVRVQAAIDRTRAEGRPVPREWVTNPFYQKYYEHRGWFASR